MPRFAIPTVAVISVLFLSGCLPTPEPPGPGTGDPTPSASPSASAAPGDSSDEPLTDLVLPACDALFTPEQVTTLMDDGMNLIGDATNPESDGGFGTSVSELKDLLRSGDPVNCTWVLPFTERGLTVSLMIVDASELAQINSALDGVGAGTTPVGGGTVIRAFAEEGEYPSTEAHGLADILWIGAIDGFGENAPALVQAALETVIALNPGRL